MQALCSTFALASDVEHSAHARGSERHERCHVEQERHRESGMHELSISRMCERSKARMWCDVIEHNMTIEGARAGWCYFRLAREHHR